jgi:hypothetical protein
MAKNWWNVGLETGIGWVHKQIEVEFDGHVFIVHPFGRDELPTVSIAYEALGYPDPPLRKDPLGEPRCADLNEALRLKQRFLSALAWVSDAGLSTHGHEGGAGHPHAAPRDGPIGTVNFGRTFEWLPNPDSDEARLALALYREGLSVNSVPYQFLGFAKVLNIRLRSEHEHVRWINENLDEIKDLVVRLRIDALRAAHRNIGRYLYRERRHAVAHAIGSRSPLNPDDPDHVLRLAEDVPLMKALARHFMVAELGVNTPGKEAKERSDGFLRARGIEPPKR